MTLYPAAINDPYMDGAARLAALQVWEGERQGRSGLDFGLQNQL